VAALQAASRPDLPLLAAGMRAWQGCGQAPRCVPPGRRVRT